MSGKQIVVIVRGPSQDALEAALLRHGGKVRCRLARLNAMSAWLPEANLAALSADSAVVGDVEIDQGFSIPELQRRPWAV